MSLGIGKNYLSDAKRLYHEGSGNNFVVSDGKKITMPRYYRDKLFNKYEIEGFNQDSWSKLAKKEKDKFDELVKLGNNPFSYEFEQTKQFVERALKRLTKKSKL